MNVKKSWHITNQNMTAGTAMTSSSGIPVNNVNNSNKFQQSSSLEIAVHRYSVLYYKKQSMKKVHRGRGQAKLDGILSINASPSCVVTLTSVPEDDSESEEQNSDSEDGNELRWPKSKTKNGSKAWSRKTNKNFSMQQKKMKKRNNVISSSVNRDIAKRAHNDALGPNVTGILEGHTVILSQWECEIVGVILPKSNAAGKLDGDVIGFQPKAIRNSLGNKSLIKKNRPIFSRLSNLSSSKAPPQQAPLHPKLPLHSSDASRKRQREFSKTSSNVCSKKSLSRAQSKSGQKHIEKNDRNFQKMKSTDSSSSDRSSEEDNDAHKNITTFKESSIPKSLQNVKSQNRPLHANKQKAVLTKFSLHSKKGDSCDDMFKNVIGNISVPAMVKSVLRPHQIEGVSFLWNCLTGSCPKLRKISSEQGLIHKGAILADEMGLGKTLMTIAVVFALYRKNRQLRSIIVCPSSLVTNWNNEFNKWIGKASQPKRLPILKGGEEGTNKIKAFVPVKPHQSEVLIISYELFRMNVSSFAQAGSIGLLVVDEGHRLKSTSGSSQTLQALNKLRCESRLLISGTPIQNNLSEFYNLVQFVNPGILEDPQTFRRLYERPISNANSKSASREQREAGRSRSLELDILTSTFMLRRLQKDVLKSLLPKKTELLIFCRPTKIQCDLYQRLALEGKNALEGSGGTAGSLKLMTKLRKLCAHPNLLDGLNHELDLHREQVLPSKNDTLTDKLSLSGKLSVLERLLCHVRSSHPDDKCVIVSNFTSSLTIIDEYLLRKHGWSSLRLDGTIEQRNRQGLVDSFNRGTSCQSFAFLLSSKAGGCGLNLIGANRLIMFDPDWNPATDHQAMARIYRQGQTKPCFIYRLFTSGTLEEVIYQRQMQKGNLASLAVDSRAASPSKTRSGFTKEEIRDCFTLKIGGKCDTKRKLGERWENYDGVSSLHSWGLADKPLLAVAEEMSGFVSFIHLCADDGSLMKATKDKSGDEDEDSGICSSSHSEDEEFDE